MREIYLFLENKGLGEYNKHNKTFRRKALTIYDIARELNLSASTVSRVINHKDCVSEATREKVEAMLRKYNYSPDVAARGLVNQATKFVGILVTDIRIRHHAEGAYIVERRLARLGYNCIIINTGIDEQSLTESFQRLAGRRIEAAVLIGSVFQNDHIRALIEQHLSEMPVVMINGRMELPNVYGILSDEQGGVESCVRLLKERGCQCIAFVNDALTDSSQRKLAGYLSGVQLCDNGKPIVITNHEMKPPEVFGREATETLLAEHRRLDGIIYSTDLSACGGLNTLAERGVAVPEQLAVIGVDNSLYAKVFRPAITSLDNRMEELGITCADTLVKLLKKEPTAKECMIMSRIVERQTT